jgi:hypothetical protein
MKNFPSRWLCSLAVGLLAIVGGARGIAQTTPAPAGSSASPSVASLSWLAGCWEGKVNDRDFREEWLPLRGDIMIGASQTAVGGRTQDFEYLRLEPRSDGVYYVAAPSGKNEEAFRLAGVKAEGADEIFTFDNARDEFPQRIIYRRATEGWLYAHVEGRLNGVPKQVIYPMRRVDCRSGELITK